MNTIHSFDLDPIVEQINTHFIEIPSGEFWMGHDGGLLGEFPSHRVELDSFFLNVYQVTNQEYALFLKATGHTVPLCWNEPFFNHPLQPVCGVNWYDAIAYCEWLGEKLEKRCHLPTEAQREWAARGGIHGEKYPWGNISLPLEGSYAQGLKGVEVGYPQEVGQQPPNHFGLFNIADNVHEWCADYFKIDYYSDSPIKNPRGPQKGDKRVARGGSWRHDIKFCQNAARARLNPKLRFADFGFRVAMSQKFEYFI